MSKERFVKISPQVYLDLKNELTLARAGRERLENEVLMWKTRANAIRDALIIVSQPNVETTTSTKSHSAYTVEDRYSSMVEGDKQ